MSAYEKNAQFCKDPELKQAMLENAEKERNAVWPPKKSPAERAANALRKIEARRAAYVRYCNNQGTQPDPSVLRGADSIISELKK